MTSSIVAVHGLNGDARRTWTDPSTGALWLNQFLPKKLPNARVVTFGYDSRLAFSGSMAGLDDFALDLLDRILALRCAKVGPLKTVFMP
jgi:hypothetical protein